MNLRGFDISLFEFHFPKRSAGKINTQSKAPNRKRNNAWNYNQKRQNKKPVAIFNNVHDWRTQNTLIKVLVTVIAENIETKMPIAKVKAKPRIEPVPKLKRITVVISDETLESRIEDQALLKPAKRASCFGLPQRTSSLILSKIKMLASTAMPIERTKPAMPAKVKVTGIILKIANTIRV